MERAMLIARSDVPWTDADGLSTYPTLAQLTEHIRKVWDDSTVKLILKDLG